MPLGYKTQTQARLLFCSVCLLYVLALAVAACKLCFCSNFTNTFTNNSTTVNMLWNKLDFLGGGNWEFNYIFL